MKFKVLAIIPARGGSKGIPHKNIKLLNGKPLIYYAIQAAIDSGVIDKLVVSTEDNEIAKVSKIFGAEVVKRPNKLATDMTLTEPVMEHAIREVRKNGYSPDYIALIQCTSPFLSSEIIKEAVSKVINDGFDSCITVFEPNGCEFKWKRNVDDSFTPEHDLDKRLRRQDLEPAYYENGAFYITKILLFERTKNRFGGKDANVSCVQMKEEDSIQMDELHHFLLAEKLMELHSKK